MDDRQKDLIMSKMQSLIEKTDIQKLDKMLEIFEEKKIFNPWMIEKIKFSDSDHEKIKSFYERTSKRGPNAFKCLKDALCSVGLVGLARLLKEKSITNHASADLPDNCPENNNNSHQEEYIIQSTPKGIVFVINISKFQYVEDRDRNGSENDVIRLKKVWESLGFEVIVKENAGDKKKLGKKDFEKCIKDFTKEEKLREVDSLFVFIMSHGKQRKNSPRLLQIECSDNLFVDSEWIIEKFCHKSCPYLAKKPKVIFFQACRGKNDDRGLVIEADGSTISRNIYVPTVSEMLVIYSSLPGSVSHRDPDNGAWYIQELCNVLEGETKMLELRDVLNQVSRNLKNVVPKNFSKHFQIPHEETFGFDKKLFLRK